MDDVLHDGKQLVGINGGIESDTRAFERRRKMDSQTSLSITRSYWIESHKWSRKHRAPKVVCEDLQVLANWFWWLIQQWVCSVRFKQKPLNRVLLLNAVKKHGTIHVWLYSGGAKQETRLILDAAFSM